MVVKPVSLFSKMNSITLLLISLLLFISIGMSTSFMACRGERVMMLAAMRSNRRSRERRISAELERHMKCICLNDMFHYSPNTCSIPPNSTYKTIYGSGENMALWKFHKEQCNIQPDKLVSGFVHLMFMLFIICFSIVAIFASG